MKINRKLRRVFNLYNIAIFICIIVILIALYIFFAPEKIETTDGAEQSEVQDIQQSKTEDVVQTKDNKGINEKKARKLAVKHLKKLGEEIKEDELDVIEIQRSGTRYYYITSKQNALEIRIENGKIERVNSEVVEE